MEIFAPDYYLDFRCKADKCKISCCVGWDVYVDKASAEKYSSSDYPIVSELCATLAADSDGVRIVMSEDGRCPMLDENGLCRLISEGSEELLCDICREHPRFYNEIGGRLEVGLGLCCEEAARLAICRNTYPEYVKIGCTSGESKLRRESFLARERIVGILSSDIYFCDKIKEITACFGDSVYAKSPRMWLDFFLQLEILSPEWREALTYAGASPDNKNHFEPDLSSDVICAIERFMIYLAYRHIRSDMNEVELFAAANFVLLGGSLLWCLLAESDNPSVSSVASLAASFSREIEYCEENVEDIMLELQLS